MKDTIRPDENKLIHQPIRTRPLYEELAFAIDETMTPILAAHWDAPTRQQILHQIEMAESEIGVVCHD